MSYEIKQLFRSGKQFMLSPMSPIESFNIQSGNIEQNQGEIGKGTYSITLEIEPFMWGEEVINTAIRLDFIDLNNLPFEKLSGTFKFPINPEDGYIDGSVYLEDCHNYIDVTSISFGCRFKQLCDDALPSEPDYIAATILYKFCWEGHDKEDYPEIKRANVILKYLSATNA